MPSISRRDALTGTAGLLASGLFISSARARADAQHVGRVSGEPTAEKVGNQVLANGGNVVDGIVAAALAAAVAAPNQTGIGGYGGTATLALDGGKKIVSLDFNSAAPAAMKPDIFEKRSATDHQTGWLSAGVPGILAGLQLALDRFGTKKFAELVRPAIKICREGYAWPESLVKVVAASSRFAKDAGSKKLYFADGKPLAAGAIFRNPQLADMLTTLAERGSVESFYRGDIAAKIADEFQKNGGLISTDDMAAYQARVVEPLSLNWNDWTIHTVPLTAGGITTLQALNALKAMRWETFSAGVTKTHAKIEAMRLAWRDRLLLLGDPNFAQPPVTKLLSDDYARACAEQIRGAVDAKKILPHAAEAKPQGGTINLSAVDRDGNLAALTLTHGQAFGAQVTVDGLGLTLGHGMSRFERAAAHPNAPGPGKRPLHNMVPTIVSRGGRAILAIGGRGGRKIPNSLFEFLTHYVIAGRSLKDSIAAPRPHSEGTTKLELEPRWPMAEREALAALGYNVVNGGAATLSAAEWTDAGTAIAMR